MRAISGTPDSDQIIKSTVNADCHGTDRQEAGGGNKMPAVSNKSVLYGIACRILSVLLMIALILITAYPLCAKEKKKKAEEEEPEVTYQDNRKLWDSIDISKIVWPNPPAITRIRYTGYWSGEKLVEKKQTKKKSSWMERLSGIATGSTLSDSKPRWQLISPNGIAVDSKKLVYIADSKVRAIFIVNVDTGEYSMIKNGADGRFKWLIGLAIDDTDRLFASDSGMHHVVVYDKDHKFEGAISEGLVDPGGIAIDNDNRLLYVTDAEQDLVLVYDADPPFKLIRRLGKPGTQHTSTVPGEFAKPADVAVDQDGNVFVADTWNNRIEEFDADGTFIRTFGEAGDGPGFFARPKGISIDSDGQIWVADGMQNRVRQLLIYMGEPGMLPGQFQGLTNVFVDHNNRIFTTELYSGRMQKFRYYTNSEARAELDRRNAESKKNEEKQKPAPSSAPADKN
jgi:DNA-binding beta-propeller fold protein YncE